MAWRATQVAALADRSEPWEHGTLARSTQFPTFYDYNLLRVEEPVDMSAEDLMAVAERHHGDLAHRRVEVIDEGTGRRLLDDFHAAGWRSDVLVWMRWDAPTPEEGPELGEATAEELYDLRLEWALSESWSPTEEIARNFMRVEAASAPLLGARWSALRGEAGRPVAFLQLLVTDAGAEIGQLYVTPSERGRGLGTSLVLSAVRAAQGAPNIWIVAEDEGRPKALYERLGFEPVLKTVNFTRLPL